MRVSVVFMPSVYGASFEYRNCTTSRIAICTGFKGPVFKGAGAGRPHNKRVQILRGCNANAMPTHTGHVASYPQVKIIFIRVNATESKSLGPCGCKAGVWCICETCLFVRVPDPMKTHEIRDLEGQEQRAAFIAEVERRSVAEPVSTTGDSMAAH